MEYTEIARAALRHGWVSIFVKQRGEYVLTILTASSSEWKEIPLSAKEAGLLLDLPIWDFVGKE